MANPGVSCNVSECAHNQAGDKCSLTSISVTHEKTGADAVATPHFCKSYSMK